MIGEKDGVARADTPKTIFLEDVRKACFKFCKPNIILSIAFLAPKDDFF
jgi:hypothetical protein